MPRTYGLLSVDEHSRDSAGMTYVYPVVSRRARGVSIGINLNPNNACNWQCIYCQVPDLSRGGPPPLDMTLLRQELNGFLDEIDSGRFMQEQVPADLRVLRDVAFSGNGEPTTAPEFADAVDLVAATLHTRGLSPELKLRLITNGSQADKAMVQKALHKLAAANGEVWFKLDAATAAGFATINGTQISPEAHLRRLKICAGICPTWIQSCFFLRDGKPPTDAEIDAYVKALVQAADTVSGVHLYGLARPSMQPDAGRLKQLPAAWFESLANRLKSQGLTVVVSP